MNKRRHPYNLGKHSNSNKNFEIHIFANINIPGKSGMLHGRRISRVVAIKFPHWFIRY
jgi:hypothetical protein